MHKITTKRKLAQLYRALSVHQNGPRILLYHSIAGGPQSTPLTDFRKQVCWISKNYAFASLDDALAAKDAGPPNLIAITFDDGYASVRNTAMPILKEFDAPATVYLNTGWICDDSSKDSDAASGHYPGETFLVWDEVRQLQRAGWTIGSHGVDHLDLTRVDAKRLRYELTQSRIMIESKMDTTCRHFAYTWGRHNSVIQAEIAAAGYYSAAAGYQAAICSGTNLLAFPRINIDLGWNLDDLRAVLRGDWDYLGWLQRGRLAVWNVRSQLKQSSPSP